MAKEFGHGEGCRRQKTSLIWFESGGEKSELLTDAAPFQLFLFLLPMSTRW